MKVESGVKAESHQVEVDASVRLEPATGPFLLKAQTMIVFGSI